MRNFFAVLAFLLGGSVFASVSPAPAAKEEPAADETMVKIRSEVLSDYVYRGQLRNDDPVSQSEVEIQHKMFQLRLWGNLDLTDEQESDTEFTEFRIDAGLRRMLYANPESAALSGLEVFGGLLYYSYPEIDRESTVELYAGVEAATFQKIHVRAAAYLDVDEAGGTYLDLTAFRKFDLPLQFKIGSQEFAVSATPEIGMGFGSSEYCEYYWGFDESSFTDWHVGLSLKAESERFEFGPSIRYSDLLDDDIEDAQNDSSKFVYGFGFAVKF